MEFVVDGTPDSCLSATYAYFVREWPYPGTIYRNEDTAGFVEAHPRNLTDSASGMIVLLLLTVIIVGAFLVVWGIWLLVRLARGPNEAKAFATPEGLGKTRLTVMATNQEYGNTLEEWVQRELVENKAAAVEASPQQSSTVQQSAADVPEQIKQLAELRDSGAITNEEFEAKKADLLNRM